MYYRSRKGNRQTDMRDKLVFAICLRGHLMSSLPIVEVAWRNSPLASVGFVEKERPESGFERGQKRM